jgi:hypothetical protein
LSAGNSLDASAYRCVDVVARNRLCVQKVQELVRGRAVGLSQEISMHKDGKQVVETAVEARGGLLGRPVLLVLLVSCLLAVAALIVTYSGA